MIQFSLHTIAIAAAKILPPSVEKVHIITRVGKDAFAKLLLKNFDESNVKYDETSVITNEAHTGVAPIIVDTKNGDNMIVVVPGKYYILRTLCTCTRLKYLISKH